MELIFPWVLYIGIPVVAVLLFFKFKKKGDYEYGKKVANTNFLMETNLYKKLYKEYKIFTNIALISLLIAIGIAFVMLARPAKVETIHPEIQNRDIFLCMDVSDSVDELNVDMCDELKKVVKELNGERFGITIFNGQSVLLVPLTSDYKYVLEIMDKLEASFKESLKDSDLNMDWWDDTSDFQTLYYKYEGTLADEGSSFIGDGLASCLYNFPDLKENDERSRLIIFTTDNDLNGEPYVTLDEATDLCKKNDVRVFAIAPDNIVDESGFKRSIEKTGGKYYRNTWRNAYDDLVKDIKKIKTSSIIKPETRVFDQPEGLFLLMLLFLGIYFGVGRKVKL